MQDEMQKRDLKNMTLAHGMSILIGYLKGSIGRCFAQHASDKHQVEINNMKIPVH